MGDLSIQTLVVMHNRNFLKKFTLPKKIQRSIVLLILGKRSYLLKKIMYQSSDFLRGEGVEEWERKGKIEEGVFDPKYSVA